MDEYTRRTLEKKILVPFKKLINSDNDADIEIAMSILDNNYGIVPHHIVLNIIKNLPKHIYNDDPFGKIDLQSMRRMGSGMKTFSVSKKTFPLKYSLYLDMVSKNKGKISPILKWLRKNKIPRI